MQLTIATPSFKSVATAVDAARTVSPFRAAYTEAAVADFVFKRCAIFFISRTQPFFSVDGAYYIIFSCGDMLVRQH